MLLQALHEGPAAWLPPKARTLAGLAAHGLPVPPGIAVAMERTFAPPEALRELLEQGPVIVRSALVGEDDAHRSAAGLGISVGPCRDWDAVERALVEVDEHRAAPWLAGYRGRISHPHDAFIVQRFIRAAWVIVAATGSALPVYIEAHSISSEGESIAALESGRTPAYSGLIDHWQHAAAGTIAELVRRVAALISGEHGVDVELVVDGEGQVSLVQARPLTTPLLPGWPAFREELTRRGELELLNGTLVLDAEHNPAPLSTAHAWLVQWLAEQRPDAGHPTVLAGWLYVRKLVRELPGTSAAVTSPTRALERLRDEALPDARRRLNELEQVLATIERPQALALALGRALAAFLAMIDEYLNALIPVRAAAKRKPMDGDLRAPLSLRGRERFADVLPAAWDIAAPALAELGLHPVDLTAADEPLPEDAGTALALLEEWDDHLFALGLAPLRRVWQSAGQHLRLGDDVFHLSGDRLREVIERGRVDDDVRATIEESKQRLARARELLPPPRFVDGMPVPVPPAKHLRGVAIGPSFEGTICQRQDLEHLIASPPRADAVVVLPALTAPAAVALAELHVRAVCCEYGGAMSHAALMARELELTALIGCAGCTTLPEGQRVLVDTRSGHLRVLG